MAEKGRRNVPARKATDTLAPGGAEQAMLIKQDEIIEKLNALLQKLDSDAVGGVDYESVIGLAGKVELE